MASRPFTSARPRLVIPVVVGIVALLVLGGVFTSLYTDLLFFRSVGFSRVFDNVLRTRILMFVLFGLLLAVAVGANVVIAYLLRPPFRPLSQEQQSLERYRITIEPYLLLILLVVSGGVGILAGISAAGRWKTWMLWSNATSFHTKDPQFHRDISYFAFTYPFERFVLGRLFIAVVLSLLAAAVTHYLFGGIRLQTQGEKVVAAAKAHLSVLLGLFALLKAVAYYLDRFALAFSPRGVVTGASYTDVHAVLPAKLILLVISLLCGVLFIYNIFQRGWTLPALAFGLLVLSAIVIGGIYPLIVQQFQVKPNEVSKEAPYIQRNISGTRTAYGLNAAVVTQYLGTATAQPTLASDPTVESARILDPNVLKPTFEQLEQVRSYYGFPATLDIDRYTANGATQDYVVAARELDQSGLAADQRNWINTHLVYTHGNGFVAAPANTVEAPGSAQGAGSPDFTEGGIPSTGNLSLNQGRIYFGELSPNYSVVDTKQQEVDGLGSGPADPATNVYDGKGGVSIGSEFRKVLFALRFGEKNLLLSGSLTKQSRILYIRNPRDRVQKVAPWLTLDGDPYPAVVGGKVVWILDGYTTSDGYPYSERRRLGDITADSVTNTNANTNRVAQGQNEINYIRNSVKATVDAYDGSVTLYAFDPTDPVLQTWMKAFPGTVRPRADLLKNAELVSHLRYPEDLFKVQRDLLGSYHVLKARDFYSKEDFWSVPADPNNSDAGDQPPFYVESRVGDQKTQHFNLTTPLLARNRPNLAAYVSVSGDVTNADGSPGDYGAIQVLQLPREHQGSGPGQVANQIESNTTVSTQLSLLRTGGSAVITGNLLTLPIGQGPVQQGLLYVEPVYVRSASGQSYPLLRKVIAVFNGNVVFQNSLSDAISALFGGGTAPPTTSPTSAAPTSPGPSGTVVNPARLAADAAAVNAAFAAYQAALKAVDYTAEGRTYAQLQRAIAALNADVRAARATASPRAGSATPVPNAGSATTSPAGRTTSPAAGRSQSATTSLSASPSP